MRRPSDPIKAVLHRETYTNAHHTGRYPIGLEPMLCSRQSGARIDDGLRATRSAPPTWEDPMTSAKDIMHPGATCIGQHQSLADAARLMRDLDVGALPICGDDDRLHGIITDRDIVLKCIAEGKDPSVMTAEELAQGKPLCVEADADVMDVLKLMEEHRIRRVPVISDLRLVGMISEADVARNLSENSVGRFVEIITAQ
jgi:CBS domain-containing protein